MDCGASSAPQIRTNLANVMADQGELDAAIHEYRIALQAAPDYAEGWNNLGVALRRAGQVQDALLSHRQALSLRPDFPEARYAEAWALLKFLSEDQTQKDYAGLLGMFPARLEPQKQVGDSSENHKAFFEAIQSGRTYAPIPQWGQIENAYKTRFGNILDSAAGVGAGYSAATVKSQLDAAAKEADGLLAQSAG